MSAGGCRTKPQQPDTIEKIVEEMRTAVSASAERGDNAVGPCQTTDWADRLTALRSSNPAAPTVQQTEDQGALEPLEFQPTEEMLRAARDWSIRKYGKAIGDDAAIGCWHAMLIACPKLRHATKERDRADFEKAIRAKYGDVAFAWNGNESRNGFVQPMWEGWQLSHAPKAEAPASVAAHNEVETFGDSVSLRDSALSRIGAVLGIGSLARDEDTILANIINLKRREKCLSAVEREFLTVEVPADEDQPEGSLPTYECLVSWGADPSEYVEQVRLNFQRTRLPAEAAPAGEEWKSLGDMDTDAPFMQPVLMRRTGTSQVPLWQVRTSASRTAQGADREVGKWVPRSPTLDMQVGVVRYPADSGQGPVVHWQNIDVLQIGTVLYATSIKPEKGGE